MSLTYDLEGFLSSNAKGIASADTMTAMIIATTSSGRKRFDFQDERLSVRMLRSEELASRD